ARERFPARQKSQTATNRPVVNAQAAPGARPATPNHRAENRRPRRQPLPLGPGTHAPGSNVLRPAESTAVAKAKFRDLYRNPPTPTCGKELHRPLARGVAVQQQTLA